VKSRSQYEIALVRQRFELDTAAMLAKSIASTENCFCASEKPIEGLLGALAKITPHSRGLDVFLTGKRPLIFTGVGDDIPNAEEEYSGMRLTNE
jgi:hypothetical protein